MRKPITDRVTVTAPLGQSNTDCRPLSDEDLARHIELLEAKRPMNWTPTAENLRWSREQVELRVGQREGWNGVKAGAEVMAEVVAHDVVYEGVVSAVTSRGFSIYGPSPYRADGRLGHTYLRFEELGEVVA